MGGEGLIGFSPDGVTRIAMVGADLSKVEQLKEIADNEKIPYRILHFKLIGELI